MNVVRSVARFSPRLILLFGVLGYIITKNGIYLRFVVYSVVTEILTALLKAVFGILTDSDVIYRPNDAGNCLGCGVVAKKECQVVENQVGMPSGHSTLAAMAATFWILKVSNEKESSTFSKWSRSILLGMLALVVIISRTPLVENCHTYIQVVSGAAIGVGLGLAFWKIEEIVNFVKIAEDILSKLKILS